MRKETFFKLKYFVTKALNYALVFGVRKSMAGQGIQDDLFKSCVNCSIFQNLKKVRHIIGQFYEIVAIECIIIFEITLLIAEGDFISMAIPTFLALAISTNSSKLTKV